MPVNENMAVPHLRPSQHSHDNGLALLTSDLTQVLHAALMIVKKFPVFREPAQHVCIDFQSRLGRVFEAEDPKLQARFVVEHDAQAQVAKVLQLLSTDERSPMRDTCDDFMPDVGGCIAAGSAIEVDREIHSERIVLII